MKDNKSLLQPSSLVPPIRPELIKSLIDGVDRYNPDNVSILEEYLITQMQTGEYDLMANLAILKLYQFNLHLVNDQVIVNILVKALTAIPNPDFNLCLYLLQESSLSDENISKLYDAQKLIEEGKYQEFWKMYETDESFKELTSEAVGFEDAIRKVIMKIISMAYQNISADLLREYLNYGSSPNDDESFKEFIKSQGLELAENNLVNIPTNIDNEAKPTVIRENIKFDLSEFDKDTIIQTTGKFIVEDGKEYLGLIQATTIEEETTIDQLPSSPALLVISARLETINRNGLKKL
ncbi:9753_t:CDS:2 [Entrophospora sp. SA101]|nr:9753_t:CDS:2 [Entrophospora sp. SA101]